MATSSIQKFFTSRENDIDIDTYTTQVGRLWYDLDNNRIKVAAVNPSTGELEPGGVTVGGGGGGTPGGTTGTIQFNDAGDFGGSTKLTFDKVTGNLTSTGNIITTGNVIFGSGIELGNVAGLNLTGSSSTVLYGNGVFAAVAGGGTPGGATTQVQFNNLGAFAGSTNLTFNQTSGNLTTGNIIATNIGNVASSNLNGNNQTMLAGDGTFKRPAANVYSSITSLLAGQPLLVRNTGYTSAYPGGDWEIYQGSAPPPTGTTVSITTDKWTVTGLTSKNQYSNFAAGTVLTSGVDVTLLINNGTFSIQPSDNITVGGVSVLASTFSPAITGNGTYTIPSTSLSTIQTQASNPVSFSLTTSDTSTPTKTGTGVTLTTTAPTPFSVNSATPTWTTTSGSVPYWNAIPDTINYNVGITGTIIAPGTGTLRIANTVLGIDNLISSTGALSGTTSGTYNIAYNWRLTASGYVGDGTNGAGGTTQATAVVGTLNAKSVYYPGFAPPATPTSTPPTITISTPNTGGNAVQTTGANPNPTAFPQATSTTNTYWVAIPAGQPVPARFYQPVFFVGIWGWGQSAITQGITPPITQTVSGQTYNLYGFIPQFYPGSPGSTTPVPSSYNNIYLGPRTTPSIDNAPPFLPNS